MIYLEPIEKLILSHINIYRLLIEISEGNRVGWDVKFKKHKTFYLQLQSNYRKMRHAGTNTFQRQKLSVLLENH